MDKLARMNLLGIGEDDYSDRIYKSAANKLAKFDVEKVEDYSDLIIPTKLEPEAKQLIKREIAKKYILRHPWVTGIPTLGLAPVIQKGVSSQRIVKALAKSHPELMDAVERAKDRQTLTNAALGAGVLAGR